jgi:hypothetical protein
MSPVPASPPCAGEAPARADRPPAQVLRLFVAHPEDAAAAAMARRGIVVCRPGQPVARLVNVPPDAPGPRAGIPAAECRFGPSVAWDAKLAAYVARKAGHALLRNGKLDVDDTLTLADDIDGATGPVTYDGQLVVCRNILDSAVVSATGTITVHGAIEAAEIRAGGDLHVHHGICGKEKGTAAVQGRLTARFVTNARATAGGDMLIANEIVNSRLLCGGQLRVDNGTILAGHAIALRGIHCHTAGSDAGAKTILEIGMAPESYVAIENALAAAEASLQKARDIRGTVEPLMAHAKNLTPAQKEKATELLFAADEAETRARHDLAAVEGHKAALQTSLDTRIVVAGLLHPGVLVRFPVAAALVAARLRGPVEIALQNCRGDFQVVAIDRCRNTVTPLPACSAADASFDFARRFLAGPMPAP